MRENPHAHNGERHKADQVRGQQSAAGLDQAMANGRGENQKAARNGKQQDGEGNSGRRANLANLADRLMNMAIARNHEGQTGDAASENDCGQRSGQ